MGNIIKATIILNRLCLLSQLRNETWWLKHWTYFFKVTAHRIKCAKMLNYCFLPEWNYRAPVTRVLVISCPQNALSHTYCFKRKNVASGIRILYHEAQQVLKGLAEGRCFYKPMCCRFQSWTPRGIWSWREGWPRTSCSCQVYTTIMEVRCSCQV